MLLIPAIDLRDGRCVRLYQGDFGRETRYPVEPAALMATYRDLGVPWVHVVDLDGARDGSQRNRAILTALAEQTKPRIQAGGGIRDIATLERLLAAGAGRVVIGSLAASQPEQVKQWLRAFGPERLVLAFDVRVAENGVPLCAIHGWREDTSLSLWDAVERYCPDGLRHVLCTDVSRDGALSGPNLDLYAAAVDRFPQIQWQASGGVRDVADLQALRDTGVAAAISGRALLEKRLSLEELRPFLPDA